MKKMVLRVNINCLKCKKEVLKSVTKLQGINEISVDGEKGTLTVIGEVDPVLVVKQLRKTRKTAEIISVGPPKKEEPKPKLIILPETLPIYCKQCELVAFGYPPDYPMRVNPAPSFKRFMLRRCHAQTLYTRPGKAISM